MTEVEQTENTQDQKWFKYLSNTYLNLMYSIQ